MSELREAPVAGSGRIRSIDALRGFDMFWIIGGDALFIAIGKWLDLPILVEQLDHVVWNGFHFYDLIFPLFLFIVGVVLPFSLSKYTQPGDAPVHASRTSAYGRILRRTLLLIVLGLIHNGILTLAFSDFRWPGVLQRIGICYGLAALIVLHTGVRGQLLWLAGLLAGYWALFHFVAAPGQEPYDLTMEHSLAGYVDRLLIPGRLYYGFGDNEGLLSTIPALGTTLLGALAGHWLKAPHSPAIKFAGLLVAAAACLAAGYAWSATFPLNKILWTSSFVLVTGGWSLALLAAFYLLIDMAGWQRWGFIFVVIGMNPITIYVVQQFVDFEAISRYFLGGIARYGGSAEEVVLALGAIVVRWLALLYLFRNKTFLRV
jgi:predicted acyltransferase